MHARVLPHPNPTQPAPPAVAWFNTTPGGKLIMQALEAGQIGGRQASQLLAEMGEDPPPAEVQARLQTLQRSAPKATRRADLRVEEGHQGSSRSDWIDIYPFDDQRKAQAQPIPLARFERAAPPAQPERSAQSEKEELLDEIAALSHELRLRRDLEFVRMIRFDLKMIAELERDGLIKPRGRP